MQGKMDTIKNLPIVQLFEKLQVLKYLTISPLDLNLKQFHTNHKFV